MQRVRLVLASFVLLSSVVPAFANPRIHRGPTAPRVIRPRTTAPRVSGIAPERATQIQTALIKEGYLTGAPSGTWDASTQAAMEKMQADNGWQTKLVPDSRAIIKLGLGPGSTPPAAVTSGAQTTEAAAAEPTGTIAPANQ